VDSVAAKSVLYPWSVSTNNTVWQDHTYPMGLQ